jgi:serine/threonine protein kinase
MADDSSEIVTEKVDTEAEVDDNSTSDSYRKILSRLAENADDVRKVSSEVSVLSNIHSLIGKVVDGRYEVLARVGQGGMGTVFKARHVILDRVIALKVLNPSVSDEEESLERFLREAQTVSKLSHPNAISCYEFGIDGNLPYLVMEFVEGENLASLIRAAAPFDLNRVYNILLQVSDALSAAHEIGIIHRDLKPENIMITTRPDGSEWAQVLDFGMAKIMNPDGPVNTKLSTTGVPCGTPHYMSPEQVVAKEVDSRCDVYAMATIAFEMLAGKTPFEEYSLVEILFHQLHSIPPYVSEANPEVVIPPSLEDVIAKGLEKDPKNRQSSVESFVSEFYRHIEDRPTPRRHPMTMANIQDKIEPAGVRTWIERHWFHTPISKLFKKFLMLAFTVAVVWSLVRWDYYVRVYIGAPVLALEKRSELDLTWLKSIIGLDIRLDKKNWLGLFDGKSRPLAARTLILAGMDIDTKNNSGETGLHLAIRAGDVEMAAELLNNKANPTIQDNRGYTPLMVAAQSNGTGIIYRLSDLGVEVNQVDRNGLTALAHAIIKGNQGAIHGLLAVGASINKVDIKGNSPLMYAMDLVDDNIARILLDRGAAVDARNSFGRTALILATRKQNRPAIEELIRRGAYPDIKDNYGKTALMYAVDNKDHLTLKLLLEAGARVDIRNEQNQTASDMAAEMGANNLLVLIQQFS